MHFKVLASKLIMTQRFFYNKNKNNMYDPLMMPHNLYSMVILKEPLKKLIHTAS